MNRKPSIASLLLSSCLAASVLTGCGSDNKSSNKSPAPQPAAKPALASATLYTNGNIYTVNSQAPSASSMLIANGKVVVIGNEADIQKQLAQVTKLTRIDLKDQFVMPGIIDAHTHPGLVSVLGSPDDEGPGLPTSSKEAFFAGLKQVAAATKDLPLVFTGEWQVDMFLPDGPKKEDLDAIFGAKPVILSDDSGHSFWLNSAALAFLKIDKNTPDLSDDLSYFVKNDQGELTGWVKEFAIVPRIASLITPPEAEFKKRLTTFLQFLSGKGVTSVWDGGNFELHDMVYSALKEMEDNGQLPLRYNGSYHIFKPEQLATAVVETKKLKKKYEGDLLKINTVKIHYDGVLEIGTAKVKQDYTTPSVGGSDGDGGLLFNAQQLSELIQQLNQEKIDLHLHTVGDKATSEAIAAIKLAKAATAIDIEITFSHLEITDKSDIDQFHALGIHANFTPHWLGGINPATRTNLGDERTDTDYTLIRTFFDKGANVTFSSDVINHGEFNRGNPFIGMQMGITRQEANASSDAVITAPLTERTSRSQMLQGYTLNGAKQLGQENWLGSLQAGKAADFIVLDNNPTTVDAELPPL